MTKYASLCLLSYNRPEFLREAIATIHERSRYPFELIVHDDGSDSAVRAVVEEFVDAGLVSTAILNPAGHNQGQGIALNRMFNMAKGNPIVKLDQDLIFNEGWLRDVVEVLEVNEVDADEPRIGLLGLFHYHHEPVDSAKTLIRSYARWQAHTHICGSGFAVPRDCWRKLGPFEEHSDAFAEDWDFQRRVTESEDFVCGLPHEDLVVNQGFGPGPSTVVLPGPGGTITVQKIEKEPVIHGR